MASRFRGRDYSSLRDEIINFLKQKLPNDWDYTNLADPVVIIAESLAMMGDQLHYTVDELRRECDMATARRKSSIYSYALREGYRMALPKGSSGIISVNSHPNVDAHLKLTIPRFSRIRVPSLGLSLYNVNAVDAELHPPIDLAYKEQLLLKTKDLSDKSAVIDYTAYSNDVYKNTQRINVVLGSEDEYNFTYNDINSDSTVNLPNAIIDRELIELSVTDNGTTTVWQYVDDIIGSGFTGNIYTLTPKFIGGAITLSIEFASNHKDQNLFSSSAIFKFKYIKIADRKVEPGTEINLSEYITKLPGYESDDSFSVNDYVYDLGNGIIGYTEYEDVSTVKENYKKLTQNYSALLTKDDFTNYIKLLSTSNCKVFDHSDNYKSNILPDDADLQPRVLYILTDAPYNERERIFTDLQERSSRSDCICMIPFGKVPYSIVIKADCFLLGTSASEVSTAIKSAVLDYYSDRLGDIVPTTSMINYIVHKASDKVISMSSCIVKDTTFGYVNSDFNSAMNLSNNDIDNLYNSIITGNYLSGIGETYLKGTTDSGVEYNKYPLIKEFKPYPDKFPEIRLVDSNKQIKFYEDIVKYQMVYGLYDEPSRDLKDNEIFTNTVENETLSMNEDYVKLHYMMPYLNRVIVLIKAVSK